MLLREWNMDEALAVRYEEGIEDGIDEGIGIGRDKGREENRNEILALIKKGYTVADIESHLLKQTRTATA
jgi:hypothetical protein